MFQPTVRKTAAGRALSIFELMFHGAVRSVRRNHGNAVIGLLMNISQMVLFVVIFYVMFTMLGMKSSAVRGDFLLYIMSGIFMFMVHTKAMGAVIALTDDITDDETRPDEPDHRRGCGGLVVALPASVVCGCRAVFMPSIHADPF